MRNTLYYGDNLPILRDHIGAASVDLVYLDPPFNSNRSYNVLFKQEGGRDSEAQVKAFGDTWHWNEQTEATYGDLVTQGAPAVSSMIGAMRQFIGDNQMMAYLVMMAARLVELHRVLKPTGSLYLHCDPTASHYLKIVMDTIFGPQNFVNEIIWKRSDAKGDAGQGAKHFGRVNDTILFYAKSDQHKWTSQYTDLDPDYVQRFYKYTDPDGRRYKLDNMLGPGGAAKGNPQYEVMGVTRYWRYSKQSMAELIAEGRVIQLKPGNVPMYKRYLDESKGTPLTTNWADIDLLRGWSSERLGYPTQKPVALLERILQASSNPGDIVLDPFCGCGTTIAAAQKLGRHWMGIDITHLSVALQKYRLRAAFGLEAGKDYAVVGEPVSIDSARQLASEDRYQFQWWALSLIQAQPLGGEAGSKEGKKGADKGIDGVIAFIDDATNKPKRVMVQVKSGKVNSATIRDLRGVVEREGGAIGVLITLEPPSQPMIAEAAAAGFYQSPGWGQSYPRLQILTVGDLLHGATLKMPPTSITFKQANREQSGQPGQPGLGLE